jgi:hypothetical protein
MSVGTVCHREVVIVDRHESIVRAAQLSDLVALLGAELRRERERRGD